MEQRSTVFVEAMVVIAVIGVLAFLIGLLARAPLRRRAPATAAGHPAPPAAPRWYEFTLALVLLGAIAAFVLWIISSGRHWAWGETIVDWQSDTRAIVFAAIMVALAVAGLAISLVYTLVQSAQPTPQRRSIEAATAETAAAATAAAPSPLRLLGLLALVVAVVLLCWIDLTAAEQHVLITQLIYPASLGVALVLLFDKATRQWGAKGGAETVREWLFCDLLTFLLVLAFLHVRSLAKPEAYAASVWDIINVVLFFAAFWVLDRTAARSRFLVGYGYLIVLPFLFLIWDAVQGVAVQASWWATMWPFLILAIVFFVLEVVTIIASAGERQALPALKDAIFVVLYAVLLIVAMGARAHT